MPLLSKNAAMDAVSMNLQDGSQSFPALLFGMEPFEDSHILRIKQANEFFDFILQM